MNAAKTGDLRTLEYLIQKKQIDVNTRGPSTITWVS